MANALTKLLKIQYPIISAPMGSISGGKLTRAVSEAGGLGLLGVGYNDSAWLKQELEVLAGQLFGAGFITWQLARKPQLLDEVLQAKPVAVMLSFGDPKPFVDSIKASGAKLICQVQTLKDAKKVKAYGADIIVAQGTEAGGHGASRGAMALVPAVVDIAEDIPVLAAGGIADGRGLAAAIMLGAQGALLGTRFYASIESAGHPNAKKCIIEGEGDRTLRGSIFDYARGLEGWEPFTARTLQNEFSKKWHNENLVQKLDAEERARYQKAVEAGDFSIGAVFAGEGVDMIHEILPAKEIVERIVKEAQQAFSRASL